MKSTRDRILEVLPNLNGRFYAVEVADMIGAKVKNGGFYQTAPYVTKILTQLCKEGVLYQWIIGVGGKHDLSDCVPSWEMFYIKRDSDLAKQVVESRGVKGYRIR